MSFYLLAALLMAIGIYWYVSQIMPERQRGSLLRFSLADGLLETLNEQRHRRGLPILEVDDELMDVAERKATHQLTTGRSDEGWDYPPEFSAMFGRSLLMETLITGPAVTIGDKLARQRDLFDGEWIRCGIGVAGGQSGQVIVALVVCRTAWEPMPEATGRRSLLERLVVGD